MAHSFLKWKSPSPISLSEFSSLFASFISQSPIALPEHCRVGVAYSGGPDSLALTVLLSKLLGNERVLALTVDHGLPGEFSSEPMSQIERLIEPFGIPHQTIRLSWPKGHPIVESSDGAGLSGKFQQLAREQRYESLFRACEAENIPLLLTAHQLDDDLVTFFYRWSRMSGAEGLAGMKPFTWLPSLAPKAALSASNSPKGTTMLGRPLLDVPRSRLLDTCMALGLSPNQDPCNLQLGQLRNSVREALVAVQAKEGEEKVSTESLCAMMKRLKMIRRESHAQTQAIISSHVLFDFCPKPSGPSPTLPLAPHTRQTEPATGDAILVLPAGSQSEMMAARYWTTNKYIMTRILCALCQYVANTPTFKGRIETVFEYARGLSASFHVRMRRTYRMRKLYSELPDLHSSLLASPLTLSEPSSSSSSSSSSGADLGGSGEKVSSNNFGSGGESDPLRRLAFLKPFNINHTTIYPLGSRDTLVRLNSSKALGSTLQSVGPALLFTRASMKRYILRNYYQELSNVQPGDAFLWDRRILLQYQGLVKTAPNVSARVVDLGSIEEFKTPHVRQEQAESVDGNDTMLDELDSEMETRKSLTSLVTSTSTSSTIMSHKMKKKFLQSTPPPFILPATEALFLSQSLKFGPRSSTLASSRAFPHFSSVNPDQKSSEPVKHDFRIVMLSLDSLKYMAKLCLCLGRTDTLAELERIRAGLPSDLLYSYPMIISHGSGEIWLPTFGISLCSKATQEERTGATEWTVSIPGKSHLMD